MYPYVSAVFSDPVIAIIASKLSGETMSMLEKNQTAAEFSTSNQLNEIICLSNCNGKMCKVRPEPGVS
ncbi:MAG: hypothetical protein DRQ44_00840 [Gammaproteobacteria bacterium]|nr:MAG: hypothetical protein DRQ44_00840 [Gammaproteobacteria bacterium]